jgi:tRNA G10  N-methylase Trm11
MSAVIGTDVDHVALGLARQNLNLLSADGLSVRNTELHERAERFGKPSYARASEAARRLGDRLAAQGGPLPHTVAQADVFEPERLRRVLDGQKPDVVITDIPYGEQTAWSGNHADTGLVGMLDSVSSVLDDDAVIVLAARGRKVLVDEAHPRIATFRAGTRAVALFRASS